MAKYECPECCGEGYDLEDSERSDCKICDGRGWFSELIFCTVCRVHIAGPNIDPEDPEYADFIQWVYCCQPSIAAEDICQSNL